MNNNTFVLYQPPYFDYCTESIVQGLKENGIGIISQISSNGVIASIDEKFENSHVEYQHDSNALIMIGTHTSVMDVLQIIENSSSNNIAVYDGRDTNDISLPIYRKLEDTCKNFIYFKREYALHWSLKTHPKIMPLPMACGDSLLNYRPKDKTFLITFIASLETNPLRPRIDRLVNDLRHPLIKSYSTNERSYDPDNSKSERIDTPKYRQSLQASLASISAPGAGFDTARYWEIPAACSLLISKRPSIVIPNNFREDVDCLFYNSIEDLEQVCLKLIRNPNFALDLIASATEHALRFHTPAKRAEHLLGCLLKY